MTDSAAREHALQVQGTARAVDVDVRGMNPAAVAAPTWADEISKMPIFPSGLPHTVGVAKPSVPHVAEPTVMYAAASWPCMADSVTPPPLHCSEPNDLITWVLASSSPPPQASKDASTANERKAIRMITPQLRRWSTTAVVTSRKRVWTSINHLAPIKLSRYVANCGRRCSPDQAPTAAYSARQALADRAHHGAGEMVLQRRCPAKPHQAKIFISVFFQSIYI